MSIFDQHYKLTHRFQGIVNAMGDEIIESLEEAAETISGKILLLEAKAEQTKSLVRKKKLLIKQRAEIEKVLAGIYKDIGKEIKDKSIEVAQAMPKIADRMLKKVIPPNIKITIGIPKLSKKEVLTWFESSQIEGLFFNDYLAKLQGSTSQRIINQTRLSLLMNESSKQAAKRIQDALAISRKSAMAFAQTAIHQARMYGQRHFDAENAERLKGLRFVCELDRRACSRCSQMDSKVYKVDDAPQPPIHMLCRCHLEPVFKNGELNRYLAKTQSRVARLETEARTVKHRDGTTSTKYEALEARFPKLKQNYNQWMSSMIKSSDPAERAFALEALGKKRFALVRSGKLQLKSLFYGGKLRTLKELERLT
ncbi:minor capsid protein [Thermodesulfobacteriota bacterium]